MTPTTATFDKTLGETTYHIDPRPVYAALACAALALALLASLVIAARRRPGAIVSPLIPTLGLAFGGITMFVYATRRLPWLRHDDHDAATVFRDAIILDAAAASVGVGTAIAAILIIALRTQGQLKLLPYVLPCAMFGMGTLLAMRHADSIMSVGSMPISFEVKGHRDMHVGHERDVPVQLMRAPQRRFWSGMEDGPQPIEAMSSGWIAPKRVHLHAASSSGKVPFTAEAHRGPVTMTTNLSVRAVPELASPLLSLRVGDRSVYRVRAKSSDGALLFFITLSGSESFHEVSIEVVGTRERDGFRTFVIEVHREDTVHEVEVVAISGETRFYDAENETVGAPVVAFTADETGPDPIPCAFALLDAPHALCQRGGHDADIAATAASPIALPAGRSSRAPTKLAVARPPVAFAGAAPASFERSTGSTSRAVVTAFVAILTLGLVIPPDGSSHASYTLVATHRGPEGAPEAPSQ